MRRLLTLLLLLVASVAQAATPYASGPVGLNQRPRIWVTQANRAALRAYIHANYPTEFQAFLDRFDDPRPGATSSYAYEDTTLPQWAVANYAFPVALGIAEMQALGYTFPASHDTDAELCSAAYTWLTNSFVSTDAGMTIPAPLTNISTNFAVMNDRSVSSDRHYSGEAVVDNGTAYFLPTIALYDWCHAELSATQRSLIADAFWNRYVAHWQGLTLTGDISISRYRGLLSNQTLGNRFPVYPDDLIFALAFWGDTDIWDASKRQEYYNAFDAMWLGRLLHEIDTLNADGWWWDEGIVYYRYGGIVPMAPAIAAIHAALGDATFLDRPWFKEVVSGFVPLAAWPELGTGLNNCGDSGTAYCTVLGEKWGYDTYGFGYSLCNTERMMTGLTRYLAANTSGALQTTFATEASIGRWHLETFRSAATSTCLNEDTTKWPNEWGTDLYHRFLFGVRGLTATTPTTLHHTLGYGNFVFRSDYTPTASHIVVSSNRYTTSHGSADYGTITLKKSGILIMNAGSARSGVCTLDDDPIAAGEANVVKSNVGIHTGTSDITLNQDAYGAWALAAYGITDTFSTRTLAPLSSSSATYSYAMLDLDPSWTQASVMQREVTYLRGTTDHEYLVVLDRVNVANTANDPIQKWWVPVQPACVDGTCTNTRAGKWTTDGKVVSVTHSRGPIGPVGGSAGSDWTLPAANAKMYLKAMLPADAKVQMLGDDGTYTLRWQNGNDDGTPLPYKNSTGCSDPQLNYLFGWGRIEVRPTTVQTTNTILTLIQFGLATSLTSMSSTQMADAATPGWLVAVVDDAQRTRVVGYGADRTVSLRTTSLTYRYPQRTPVSDHVLADLAPGQTYYTAVERAQLALVGPVSVIALPFGLLPFLRRRTVLIVLVLVAGVIGGRWLAVQPVMLAVEVSTSPNGGMPRVADAAGVISFEVTR